MTSQTTRLWYQNPAGYEIAGGLLQEFERGLDPFDPNESRIPCHILGYGEISTVFEIPIEGLRDLAFKRMCIFETWDELEAYRGLYLDYNRILEEEAGLTLPPYGYAAFSCGNGRPVFYIVQKRLPVESIGSHAIHRLPPQETIALLRLILQELYKVWKFNREHAVCQVGIDGQISNWAIDGFDPGHPRLVEGARLYYLDTSSPFCRMNGTEQANAELFLRSAPPYLVWVLRLLFLEDVMTRYYDARQVMIDLIANFYKEQRSELIPGLVAATNAFIENEAAGLGIAPIDEKEVAAYYREDRLIWSLYLSMRRFDRFVRRKMLHREYPYILPGKIKR